MRQIKLCIQCRHVYTRPDDTTRYCNINTTISLVTGKRIYTLDDDCDCRRAVPNIIAIIFNACGTHGRQWEVKEASK
jgi:hypothetical protein